MSKQSKNKTGYYIINSVRDIESFIQVFQSQSDSSLILNIDHYHSDYNSNVSAMNLKSYLKDIMNSQLTKQLDNYGPFVITFFVKSNYSSWGEAFGYVRLRDQTLMTILIENVLNDKYIPLFENISITQGYADLKSFLNQNTSQSESSLSLQLKDLVVGEYSCYKYLYDLSKDLLKIRSNEELKLLLTKTETSYLSLFKQSIELGLSSDNEKLKNLANSIKEEMLSIVKTDMKLTVDEQSEMLNTYKSHYPNMYV